MVRKSIKPPSPESPIVGYKVHPVTKRLIPISAKSLRAAKNKRPTTRSCTLPEFHDDDNYSDIDPPDLLIGLRGCIYDLETKLSIEPALGVTSDTCPTDAGTRDRRVASVTRDDLIDQPRIEGLEVDVLISNEPLPTRFIHPTDVFSGYTEFNVEPLELVDKLPPIAGTLQLIPEVSVSPADIALDVTLQQFVPANTTRDEVYPGSSFDSSNPSSDDITLPSSSSRPGSRISSPLPSLGLERFSPINTPALFIADRIVCSPVPISSTVASIMAPSEQEIATAITSFLRANDDYVDEYSDLVFEYLPPTELTRLRDIFLSHKNNLADCYHTVRAASVDILAKVGSLQAVADLKKAYIALIAKSFEYEHNRNRVGLDRPRSRVDSEGEYSNDPSVADSIRSSRVTGRTDTATTAAKKIVEDLRSISLITPSTHRELDNLESKCESAKLQKQEIMPELKELAKSAMASGLRDQAEKLTEAIDDLSDSQRLAIGIVHQAKIKLGVPLSGFHRPVVGTSKPPTFSGDFSSGLDFFSFVEAFEEYAGSMRLYSALDKFQRLRADCLTGPARSAVTTCKTFDESIDLLRNLYGKPRVLYSHKEREVIKEGRCPSTPLERRTWFITVHNRIVALRDLAETHNILDSFHTSSIFDTIVSSMTAEDRQLYKTRLIDQMTWDPDLDQSLKATVGRLISFLGRMCHRAGLELDYSISCFDKSDDVFRKLSGKDRSKKSEKDKDKEKDGDKSKRPDNKDRPSVYKVSPGTESPGSEISGGFKSHPQKGAAQAKAMAKAQAAPLPPIAVQTPGDPVSVLCCLCNNEHTSIAYCLKYQKSRVKERWDKLKLAGACFRCLRLDARFEPGRRREWWEAHKGVCSDEFICKEGDCGTKPAHRQFHFTVCFNHITSNKPRQVEFIATLEPPADDNPHRFFSISPSPTILEVSSQNVHQGIPFYMVHFITTKCGATLLTFYDSGCLAAAVSTRAARLLDSSVVRYGPTPVDVAGGKQLINPHGDVAFDLQLVDGSSQSIKALQMDAISSPFPEWDMTKAWNLLVLKAKEADVNVANFPQVPCTSGGAAVDLILGMKYLNLHPIPVFKLPSGLTLFQSQLKCTDGLQGVLGGPPPAFADLNLSEGNVSPRSFLSAEVNALKAINFSAPCVLDDFGPTDVSVLHLPDPVLDEPVCDLLDSDYENYCSVKCYRLATSDLRDFHRIDEIGSLMEYRCIKCRNCGACRQGEEIERLSLVEEAEQNLIENSLFLDVENKQVIARLPFTSDPRSKMNDNFMVAKKILQRQINKFVNNPDSQEGLEKAHNKLLLNGHVVPLSDLPLDQQAEVLDGGYFIPWSTFLRLLSLSTPVRMVFDASSKTPGGLSLNDCLAKGGNTLSKLLNLLFRFRSGAAALSADIMMCYNAIKLHPADYKYQKYLWCPDLSDPENIVVMIIKTLIYGVKPSGNLTIAAIKRICEHAKSLGGIMEKGALAIDRSIYMDDIIPSFWTVKERDEAAKGIVETLSLGSMKVKAVTLSGHDPPEAVSADGESVGLLGYRWKPLQDVMLLDVKPIALGKSKRGERPPPVEGDLREALAPKFTRSVISGQVAQVFDPLGMAAPITGKLKADLSALTKLQTDWEEVMPPEFLDVWVANIQSVQLLNRFEFPRNAFPTDDSSFELIVAADASQQLSAACVYSRVQVSPNKFECHLVSAKTFVANKLTIPKAELKAATMAANLGHLVKSQLENRVSRTTFITDSSIVLSWLVQDQRPLQVGVRNSVINIRSLSNLEDWFHVPSRYNPADLPSRFCEVSDILGDSEWLRGQPWMSGPREDMPLRTISEIQLDDAEKAAFNREIRNSELRNLVLALTPDLPDLVQKRYEVSGYLIDPASMSWEKYVRSMGVLYRCSQVWSSKTWDIFPSVIPTVNGAPVFSLSPKVSAAAMRSTFVATTAEVKKFNSPKAIAAVATELDGILVFNGRILDDTRPKSLVSLSFDLLPRSFCRPVVDRYSPVAYSVMLYVHNTLTNHGSILHAIRVSAGIVYIMGCRSLAIEIRESCHHCKRYKVRLLEAALGPLHPGRLAPAPAFYLVQVDLFGPFLACSEHNFRSKVKIWGCVFKCMSTLSVWVECLTKSDVGAFLQAYVRFSARFGHVGKIHIDPGSQLLAFCKGATFSFADLTRQMNGRYGVSVDYEVCSAGSHQAQGQAERSIREIRRIFSATFRGLKLDVMSYSTAFAFISNQLNNIPIGIFGRYRNLESTEFLTPARLIMGRNNQRSPIDLPVIAGPSRLLKQMRELSEAWWETWDKEWLVGLIPKASGWPDSSPRIAVGNIVVFQKLGQEAKLGKTPWRTGRVVETHVSKDNVCRSVTLEYKNVGETKMRTTKRSVRTVGVLYPEDELDLCSKLNAACKAASIHQLIHTSDHEGGCRLFIEWYFSDN